MKTILLGKYYYCCYVMGLCRSSDLSKVIQQIWNGGVLDSKSRQPGTRAHIFRYYLEWHLEEDTDFWLNRKWEPGQLLEKKCKTMIVLLIYIFELRASQVAQT